MLTLSTIPQGMYSRHPKGRCPVCGKMLQRKSVCDSHAKEAQSRQRRAYKLLMDARDAHLRKREPKAVSTLLGRQLCQRCWGTRKEDDGAACTQCAGKGFSYCSPHISLEAMLDNVDQEDVMNKGVPSPKKRAKLKALKYQYKKRVRNTEMRLEERRKELVALGVRGLLL